MDHWVPMPNALEVFCGSPKMFSVENIISLKLISPCKPEVCPLEPCSTRLLCKQSWSHHKLLGQDEVRHELQNQDISQSLLSMSKTFYTTIHLRTSHFTTPNNTPMTLQNHLEETWSKLQNPFNRWTNPKLVNRLSLDSRLVLAAEECSGIVNNVANIFFIKLACHQKLYFTTTIHNG